MRVLFGIVVGVCLTVSAAFISDSWNASPAAATTGSNATLPEHRPMVNWDVVGDNWNSAKRWARGSWTSLSQKVSN